MKKSISALALMTAVLAGCNQSKNNDTPALNKLGESKLKVSFVESSKEVLKEVSYEDISFNYNPTNLVFESSKLILRDTGEVVARVRTSDKVNDRRITLDTSGANPILEISGAKNTIELEIVDLGVVDQILKHNIYDRTGSNDKELSGNTIILNKESKGTYQNLVSPISEAPIQNLTANILNAGPKKIGTYEFWFNRELKMVKESNREILSKREFEVIKSIDLMKSEKENFQVKVSFDELSSDFNLFKMTVVNNVDEGAFVTSNPISALGHRCNSFNYLHLVQSKRIENGIEYTLPVNKGMDQNCLKSSQLSGKIYIFDSTLNFLEVQF